MIRPHTEIVDATEDDIVRFYGPIVFQGRWVAKAIRKGSLVSAFGGLIEENEGEWLAFFEVPPHLRRPSIYRHIVAAFNEVKGHGAKVIKAICDTRIDGAEKLIRHLGFLPTDSTINGMQVFEWRI